MQHILPPKRSNSGYTLVEALVSLIIISFLLQILYPSLASLYSLIKHENYLYQDEIGIYQLQILLATNKITEVNEDEIVYLSSENECSVSCINDNVVSTPGWLCYLYHVDFPSFFIKKDIIYIEYYRNGEYYEYPIAYKE